MSSLVATVRLTTAQHASQLLTRRQCVAGNYVSIQTLRARKHKTNAVQLESGENNGTSYTKNKKTRMEIQQEKTVKNNGKKWKYLK